MTTTTNTDTILDILLRDARREILKEFNPDSCIVSTAVTIDVLKHFGVSAEPLPVRAMIFNVKALWCIEQFGMPRGDTMKEWGRRYGAWSIGLGFGDSPLDDNKYVGHLVAQTADGEIIDLSLDQADRPQYGIKMTPLKFKSSPELFTSGTRQVVGHCGCILTYEKISNQGYTQSPNWYKRSQRAGIVARIIARIEEKEDECQTKS